VGVAGKPSLRAGHRRQGNGRDPVASVDTRIRPKLPGPG
jgi:hypothetical protein